MINDEDDEKYKPYDFYLYRGNKYISRKDASPGDSANYMRWIINTIIDSQKRRRRLPHNLAIELVSMLNEATEKAEAAQALASIESPNEEQLADLEKTHQDACRSLLSGFGLARDSQGRPPTTSFWDVIKFMDEAIKEEKRKTGKILSVRAAARLANKQLSIAESTARRYWKQYQEMIKPHLE